MSVRDEVRRYYDANTRRFLAFGQGGEALAIHRLVHAPGVTTREEAAVWINRRVAELFAGLEPGAHLIDLGCGVGGTALWLARHRGVKVTGVTISPVQVEAARRFAAARPEGRHCRFLCGDFADAALLPPADGAYAIEAFAHVPEPEAFFRAVSSALPVGGRLVLVDDFMGEREGDARVLERFRRGWCVQTLLSPEAVAAAAARSALRLVGDEDLTPFLALGRPRDRLIRLLVAVLRPLMPRLLAHPGIGTLAGGDALQQALARGWIRYRILVFERVAPAGRTTPQGPAAGPGT